MARATCGYPPKTFSGRRPVVRAGLGEIPFFASLLLGSVTSGDPVSFSITAHRTLTKLGTLLVDILKATGTPNAAPDQAAGIFIACPQRR